MATDPIAGYLKLAAIPRESFAEVEGFLRRQESISDTLAVLERPDQPVALLRIHDGEATVFSFPPEEGGRRVLHEAYIGKIYDATITLIHAVDNLGDPSAARPDRVEIAGSRLGGMINLTSYADEERTALMDALREIVARG